MENNNWKTYLLSDISSKIGDGLHGTPKYDGNGDYYFINGNNLINGSIVFKEDTKKVTEDEFLKYRKDLNDNSVLISINGTIGNLSFYRNEKVVLGKSAAYVNLLDTVDKKFVYYNFKSKFFQNYLVDIATGTTIPNVPLKGLREYEIQLPPLPEQKAIASVLSSLDDKIDLLNQQNRTLEALAETLFRQWFIEDAKEDWEEGKLGDFLTPKKGKNLTKAKAIDGPYFVVAGGLEPMCMHNESNTEEPVITISASGANAGFVRLYNEKVWSSDSSYIDNTITPYVYFSYLFLKSNQKILFDKQTGSAQPHIYPQQIMELEFRKYPESLISEFENRCTSFFQKIKSNQIQIRTLTQLRDTLLPKLMSGEVRVKM